ISNPSPVDGVPYIAATLTADQQPCPVWRNRQLRYPGRMVQGLCPLLPRCGRPKTHFAVGPAGENHISGKHEGARPNFRALIDLALASRGGRLPHTYFTLPGLHPADWRGDSKPATVPADNGCAHIAPAADSPSADRVRRQIHELQLVR